MKNKHDARMLERWMQKAEAKGLGRPPQAPVERGPVGVPSRKKSDRTARLELRVTPDERRRTDILALRDGTSLNELYSRMLTLYEREHGKVSLMPVE
jgi:hypothetical protein